MAPLNRIPLLFAMKFVKHWVEELVGGDNADLLERETLARISGTPLEDFKKWMEAPETQEQLEAVVSSANDCFFHLSNVDRRLRDGMRQLSPSGETELYSAIEALPESTDEAALITALGNYLARDFPNVPAPGRELAAQAYLSCLRKSLLAVKDYTPRVVGDAVLRIEERLQKMEQGMADIDRNAAEAAEAAASARDGVARLSGRFDEFYTLWQQQASTNLKDQMIPFASLIETKTRGFIGRAALFRAVEGFLNQSPGGYFLIRGEPGIGKTAFMARLVQQRQVPHHFNIFSEGTGEPGRFFLNMSAQLIAFYQLEHVALPRSAGSDNTFFKQMLEAAADASRRSDSQKVILLIDALDEAERTQPGRNPLDLPQALPENVFIICSTRQVGPASGLRAEGVRGVLDIDPRSPENLEDVRAFIKEWLARPTVAQRVLDAGIQQEALFEALLKKSEGNFMYLHYVLGDIEAGHLPINQLGTLPQGLRDYYWQHWERMQAVQGHITWKDRLKVIAELAISTEPISPGLLTRHSGLAFGEVMQVIYDWMQFLHETRTPEGPRYRIYHNDYRDFLAQIVVE